jgi:hypothetical protein|tara:strand:- start:1096 stop:1725 length:630 start_codon:yes stop_codon:yes gene_type:complete
LKKLNYFDLGLYRGTELNWMISNILPSLNITNYQAFGFEACLPHFNYCQMRYSKKPNVQLFHLAIADKEGPMKLYHADNNVGHSIFKSKINVRKDKYEITQGVIFSKWLQQTVPDFKECFNILKCNIEGSEFYLFFDLVNNDLLKHFDIFCGSTKFDVKKIEGLHGHRGEDAFNKLLVDNNVKSYRFTEHVPEKNWDIKALIKEKYLNE